MYKLIVSDIDGTLIRDDSTISDHTQRIIREARDRGVEFMLVTGRLYGAARPYIRELEITSPVISCNGGVIKDGLTGQMLVGHPIKKETLKKVFQILMEQQIYFHFYGEENFYSQKFAYDGISMFRYNQSLEERDRFPMFEVPDPYAVIETELIYKVLFRCVEPEDRQRFQEVFSNMPGISLTSSWSDNFELCAEGVSKGKAVREYAESQGIKPEEIISFGDNINDLSMIEYAGMGVAVANAVDELKDIADHITEDNNNEGVARAINKFVLRGEFVDETGSAWQIKK